ncbi:DUF624 domain-containing protein, partial [Turicibacter sanguinis]|nr:DUF624 domain-containing protein [Turicibacter sanguinis]
EGKLYQFANYVAQMLLINFYMVIGSLMGLLVFGIAPSFYAGLKLIKEIVEEERDTNLFTRFMQYYRQSFVKANKIGFSYLLIFTILGINVYYYDHQLGDGFMKVGILVMNYFLIFITLLSFMTYMGIEIRFNCRTKEYIKMSILFPIFYFLNTIGFLIAGIAIFFILTLFSQFIAFLFAAAYCYLNHYYVSGMAMKFKKLQEEKFQVYDIENEEIN